MCVRRRQARLQWSQSTQSRSSEKRLAGRDSYRQPALARSKHHKLIGQKLQANCNKGKATAVSKDNQTTDRSKPSEQTRRCDRAPDRLEQGSMTSRGH
jgi:hypothetical protein